MRCYPLLKMRITQHQAEEAVLVPWGQNGSGECSSSVLVCAGRAWFPLNFHLEHMLT